MGLIIPAFPSYHDWIGWSERPISDNDADYYPTRSHIGKYLNLRYLSFSSVLENAGILLRVKEVIKKMESSCKGSLRSFVFL
jgi:hypothetical protein